MTTRANADSAIKPDIVLPDGSRLRSLPWGGRQYAGMGLRVWSGGFEAVSLNPKSLEPEPDSTAYRFATLLDAAAWARFITASAIAALCGEPSPPEPPVKPMHVMRTERRR